MKRTLFFVCLFLCATHLFAADAQPSASIEQSSASGEQCAQELSENEQQPRIACASSDEELRALVAMIGNNGELAYLFNHPR